MDNEQKAKADELFDEIISNARRAADLDTAAGYAASINAMKWAASVLSPSKYGTKVIDENGNTAGYMLETGIRRVGDPGYVESGAPSNGEAESGTEVLNQDGSVPSEGFINDVGFDT